MISIIFLIYGLPIVPSQASSPVQSERQTGAPDDQRDDLAAATDNPKRVVGLSASTGWAATPTLDRMLTCQETKTVWHPAAMQEAGVRQYKIQRAIALCSRPLSLVTVVDASRRLPSGVRGPSIVGSCT